MSEAVKQASSGENASDHKPAPKPARKKSQASLTVSETTKAPLIDRAERGGHIGRLLLVGLLLLGLVVSACVFLAEVRKKKIVKDIIHVSNFTTEK